MTMRVKISWSVGDSLEKAEVDYTNLNEDQIWANPNMD